MNKWRGTTRKVSARVMRVLLILAGLGMVALSLVQGGVK